MGKKEKANFCHTNWKKKNQKTRNWLGQKQKNTVRTAKLQVQKVLDTK